MKCAKCGQELPENAVFCTCCGEKVTGAAQGDGRPVYESEVKGWLKSGKLSVYRDRVEFSASSAQKTVFDYASLAAVKKRLLPTPAILFITEDARTESCAATSKNIHEAFLHVEQAVKPYLEARKARLLAQGIRYSFVSSMGMTNSGILNLGDDRAEFLSKSGKTETVPYEEVKSAALSAGGLELSLFNGSVKSFGVEKELRDEVLAYVRGAIEPYLAKRKADLLARGIYFSYLSAQGQETGTMDIYEDRAEFTARSGRVEAVPFQRVRLAQLYTDFLEFHMVDGSVRSFAVDRDEQNEILAFVRSAVEPYMKWRTEGFDTVFGSAERFEVNRERGVFHLIRQNGAVITDEQPLESLAACRKEEPTELNPLISGLRIGGKAIADKAHEMAGKQGEEEEEQVRSIDLVLTIQSGEDRQTESLRFGDFPIGVSRTSSKYIQCSAEADKLMDFLRSECPACELTVPEPAAPKAAEEPIPEAGSESRAEAAEPVPAGPGERAASQQEKDPLGVQKYIDRISQYIDTCQTPMTIAFQGSSDRGESNMLKMLSGSLEERYKGDRIWLHTKQLSRSDLGEKLPMFLGATLVSQLGGANDGRVVKFAKAFINLSVTLISQGNSDGQFFIDAFFKENPKSSLEDMVETFSELVRKKTAGGKGKVIVFVDGLDGLAPAKMIEVLEAMEDFFACEGCVFVVAVDYAAVIRGINERYGQDEARGKNFFSKVFRISFRMPASGYQMESYVKTRLDRLGLSGVEGDEVESYCRLLAHSIGGKPERMGQLFDSFELLKTLADEDMYTSGDRRLILFGLLCMQNRFPAVYSRLVQMKNAVTPALLAGMCDLDSDLVVNSGLPEEERPDFREFAQTFCGITDNDGGAGISQMESSMFAQVLEFTSITSM